MSAEVPQPASNQDSRSLRRDLYRQAALGRREDYIMFASIIPCTYTVLADQYENVVGSGVMGAFAIAMTAGLQRYGLAKKLWTRKEKNPGAFTKIGIDPTNMKLTSNGGLRVAEKSQLMLEDRPIPLGNLAQKIAVDLSNMIYLSGPIRFLKYRGITTGRVLVTEGKEDVEVRPLPVMLQEHWDGENKPNEDVFHDSIKRFLKEEGWSHILPELTSAGLVVLKRVLKKMENNPKAADLGMIMALERVQKFRQEVKARTRKVTIFDVNGKVA